MRQSLETAGFQAKNWSAEMPLSLAREPQLSLSTTTSHLLQSDGWPVCVGAGGVGAAVGDGVEDLIDDGVVVTTEPLPDLPTQYACPSQKFVMQSLETAGFHSRNVAREIPALSATDWHESLPDTTCQPSQSDGWPSCVGAGGWGPVPVGSGAVVVACVGCGPQEPQYRRPTWNTHAGSVTFVVSEFQATKLSKSTL